MQIKETEIYYKCYKIYTFFQIFYFIIIIDTMEEEVVHVCNFIEIRAHDCYDGHMEFHRSAITRSL